MTFLAARVIAFRYLYGSHYAELLAGTLLWSHETSAAVESGGVVLVIMDGLPSSSTWSG